MNLRTQLTLAFLALALVPTAIVSAVSLRQLVEIKELWESAGLDGLLNSSEVVASRSLERMRYDLQNAANPLLERLKFASIVASNLDEFFMVRVAAHKHAVEEGDLAPDFSGLGA